VHLGSGFGRSKGLSMPCAGCGFEISSDPEEADVQIVRLKL